MVDGTEEGKIQWNILEALYLSIKDMQGIPINQREEEGGEEE